jgi:putative transposase
VYTTNAIESLNSRFRHVVRRRGHFPNEQAALKSGSSAVGVGGLS